MNPNLKEAALAAKQALGRINQRDLDFLGPEKSKAIGDAYRDLSQALRGA